MGTTTDSWRRAVGIVLVLVVAAVLAPVQVHAQEAGIFEAGHTTWEVRPNDGTAVVTISLALRNDGDTEVTRHGLYLPSTPSSIRVEGDGSVVDHDLSDELGLALVEWDLPTALGAGDTQQWRVDVTLESAPPRSDFATGPRITNGYVAVPIWGWGANQSTLEVRVPERMGARLGSVEPVVDDEGWSVFTVDDASIFTELLVGAASGADGDTVEVDVGDTTVSVQAWADDPEWGTSVADFAVEALPALATWTGTPWQGDELLIRETATPEVAGWGGWNDSVENVISVGEEFDPELWTHELSHNWFNHREFSETWLIEGLAQVATEQLAGDLGIDQPQQAPDGPAEVEQGLVWWNVILVQSGESLVTDPAAWYDTTRSLYDTAHWLMSEISTEIGEETFREVVGMSLREESAWGPLGTPPADEDADWREFLDLVERVGGSETARGLVLAHVDPTVGPELERRDQAIAAWEELDAEPWGVPAAVATEMHAWRFDEVDIAIARARTLRDEVVDVETRAEAFGLPVPGLRDAWATGSFDGIERELGAMSGLLTELDGLETAAARAGLPPPRPAIDPDTDDPEQMAQVVSSLRGAVTRLESAEVALDRATGDPVARLGMSGDDPEPLLRGARDAIAVGDAGRAATATRQLDEMTSGAALRGWLWIIGVASVVLLVVGGLVALVSLQRRRGRDTPDVGAPPPPSWPSSSPPPPPPPTGTVSRGPGH